MSCIYEAQPTCAVVPRALVQRISTPLTQFLSLSHSLVHLVEPSFHLSHSHTLWLCALSSPAARYKQTRPLGRRRSHRSHTLCPFRVIYIYIYFLRCNPTHGRPSGLSYPHATLHRRCISGLRRRSFFFFIFFYS